MSVEIISCCSILNNQVKLNGEMVLAKDTQVPFNEFIKAAYDLNASPYLKFFKMDDLCKLAFVASEFLLKNRKLSEQYGAENVSLLFANTSSSLDTDIHYYNTVKDFASPSLFVYTLPNIMLGEISIRNKFKGENAFFVFEHFQADFLCNYATQLIQDNKAKAVIIGWVELLKENYEAFLCLIEETEEGTELTKENLSKLYNGK
jgi:replication initiation and membrane attachment protein DnaB